MERLASSVKVTGTALASHLLLAFPAAVWLIAGRWLWEAPLSIRLFLIQFVFVVAISWIGTVVARVSLDRREMAFPWLFLWLAVVLLLALAVYELAAVTGAAWVLLGTFYVLLLSLSVVYDRTRWPLCIAGWAALSILGGVVPVVAVQIESQFADEEFFVALQAVHLAVFTALLIVPRSWADRSRARVWPHVRPGRTGLSAGWVTVGLCLVNASLAWPVARAYEASFYSASVPVFPGITPEQPFICGTATPDTDTPSGQETFQRFLAAVAANPRRETPEYGMLALGTGEEQWATAFRDAILGDATQGLFTGPANSVKFGQYRAALRAYYFARVSAAFPGLFSEEDSAQIRGWLAEVNQRAMTVEWVDWMYGLAFASLPRGPYENQENGAGLLSVLEAEGLAAENLRSENRAYLARQERGWEARFRNTDDAYVYQTEWINNALLQSSLPDGAALMPNAAHNRDLAFEWLLVQALPDGAPLGYNHPGRVSAAEAAYLGATLLGDPRFVWWSARQIAWAQQEGLSLSAQPGVDAALALDGVSPEIGSCLLYGDSGVPTQVGPLAPDKIVFRDGWTADSRYLLLDLRFTGWHRYKATNTISLLYQGGPVVAEDDKGERTGWLPVGRSLFRDKRIPRENLNGLVVSRTGLAAVLNALNGLGGPWAQDPPHYAEVVQFETSSEADSSRTVVTDWHGWNHEREVDFYHSGPIIVVDRAHGPRASRAAVAWQLPEGAKMEGNRVLMAQSSSPMEMVLISLDPAMTIEQEPPKGAQGNRLLVRSDGEGTLTLVTVFLSGDWLGAEATLGQGADGQMILHLQSIRRSQSASYALQAPLH
jgi:hypothetical protein